MTEVINTNKAWLEEQISKGIANYLECEGEELIEIIKSYVYRQIYIAGCSMNCDIRNGNPKKLCIEIDVPNPEECSSEIENI